MRWIYFGLAWLFFALGIAGILLPVMPGTVFMILALWAFSRSSPRFHSWLFHHKWFGPPLQRWERHRVVPWSARIVAYSSMMASLIYFGFVAEVHWAAPITIGVIAVIGVVFISRCPSSIEATPGSTLPR